MKKIIFSIVVTSFIWVSCDHKSNNSSNHMNDDHMMMNDDSTMSHNHSHNEKDGQMMMNNDTSIIHNKSHTMENHEKMYTCSMHPNVFGKKGEKCPKCGMTLVVPVTAKKEDYK